MNKEEGVITLIISMVTISFHPPCKHPSLHCREERTGEESQEISA